ncbi:MAG: pullulanase-type alpha-1,6-glucosidase [Candidatus Nanopelagicales bacterium]
MSADRRFGRFLAIGALLAASMTAPSAAQAAGPATRTADSATAVVQAAPKLATTVTDVPSVTVVGQGSGTLPGDADLAGDSVRQSTVGQNFYFVLPDRFANGDPTNDTAGVDPAQGRLVHGLDPTDKGFYHGGDLAGLADELDYLDDLGIDAVWLTPMFKNRWVQGEGADVSAGYHGYWTVDYTQIDPHFGTNQQMADVIAAAHAKGIKVYFDIITNHTADVIKYEEGTYTYRSKGAYPYLDAAGNEFDDAAVAGTPAFPTLDAGSFPYTPTVAPELADAKTPAWLNDVTVYHNRGDSTFAGESSQYGDFFGLDDLFTEDPRVVDGMIDIFSTWISELGIDGYRIDTVKHVNDEFWTAFAPAIQAYATANGKPDFFFFGEVFDGNPAFTSRYTTELKLPAVLDFPFQGKATEFAQGGSAEGLAGLFAQDDLYIDADSNAYSLPTFLGNHDMGRIGYFLRGSDDKLARSELAHSLMYLSRGNPVVYYGDEQGFVGDGGDKDARQDMFASQVASYNDDDLIGTDATTEDDNFDADHPLYQHIAGLAALTDTNPALGTGLQQHRYAADGPGIYAFSRMDWEQGVEYVVALNNATTEQTASIPTYSADLGFTGVFPDGLAAPTTNASRELEVTVPALSAVVYKADAPVADSAAPGITLSKPPVGSEVTGTIDLAANVGGDAPAQVTFAVRADGGDWTVAGTDDNAPYSMRYDLSGLAKGTDVDLRAIVKTRSGELNADMIDVTVGEVVEPPPATSSGADHLIVHYNRPDGDYDGWGVHAWGDVEGTPDWANPIPFNGEDAFGRFAWVPLTPGGSNVGFIIHNGDTKDTDGDRFVNPQVTPEIWINSQDGAVHESLAAARGVARIHYHRDDGDYGTPSEDYTTFWGLHLWGDAIAEGQGTEWTAPMPPTGTDDFGVYWDVALKDPQAVLNFIIHRGDTKDVGSDESMTPAADGEVWRNAGVATLFPTLAAAQNKAVIHYHRPDGEYGDYDSSDFNDFWGLHLWTGAATETEWPAPLKPVRVDSFGPVFEVPLVEGATRLNFINHRGDTKDPNGDQSLDLTVYGNEAWFVSGQEKDNQIQWLLPIVGRGVDADLTKAQAQWLARDTVLWKAESPDSLSYSLRWSADGGITAGTSGVEGGRTIRLSYDPQGMTTELREKWPHLSDFQVFKVRSSDLDDVPDALRGQVVAVEKAVDGALRRATSVQIPGVLDDLYADAAEDVDLGPTVRKRSTSLRLWAPTAQQVKVLVFDTATAADPSATLDMTRDDDSGVWSASAKKLAGRYYLYQVEVWAPGPQEVVTNIVTDPYSLSLSTNSARSQVVDLSSKRLAPKGWDRLAKPKLKKPEDISVYELHVRDFSASDPTVPAAKRGTFEAFALEGTNGTDHLEALADAGLSHVHLLPAFDFATVNEDRSTWESPDPAVLAALPPDSEEQQAAVSATAGKDGFNWGYDPWHYTVPEGSYSTDPQGARRIVEFRDMVKALNNDGLRVVMDVVYNHTTAAGQDPKSVLDRVVPGYYQRLNDVGGVETSTCCSNTATEHAMMGKLMIDSVVTWAKEYKVDGFRFDLMGHHSKQNMLDLRAALDDLTMRKDGVDGKSIYLYGEGWNFGEVADNARFVQATQANMAGTGIGTFNDRLRDAVRGGGPFDGGDALVTNQGLINGLWYDPNEMVEAPGGPSVADRKAELLLSADQVRVGLAGNLADYEFVDRNGDTVTGAQVDYNGAPTGYTADPQENIVYVEAHDNQTLFDISAYKHPRDTSMADRVRAQNLGADFTVLSQGIPFVHAGAELLRSKSLDRNSYDSGDWFNRLDFSGQQSAWGSGLPLAADNADNWPLMRPLLADAALKPAASDIATANAHMAEMLEIRNSSKLFRLRTEKQIQQRVTFANTGPYQVPGLVVMQIADQQKEKLAGGDLDRKADGVVALFNSTDEPVDYTLAEAKGAGLVLHPVQADSADPVVRSAAFDSRTGTFEVPARTTAVFVEVEDREPPVVEAQLVPVWVSSTFGKFRVAITCTDNVTRDCASKADINGVEVADGDLVQLIRKPGRTFSWRNPKTKVITILAPSFTMKVTCTDEAGNSATKEVQPEFRRPWRPWHGWDHRSLS